ncbi:hypothetical protein Fleli_0453 [Bernardetia litoralis DSM 6794]|uniref:Uncharacterized protein n=1 Tax=Bernardetia litoralis (strain ATCC 23117 / DSM 6794 / NBRC 15988 / NCIMB 1366 / Fx l1 / Sio-4) TaxID=880071 RepID=I4AG44_BERLS|nr:hypothetical protein [Bernardetia litoralis]AFM02929.1 hypothetical protein Fleli_0453 [Bernardetia litoralis DSM 6794]
MLRFFSFILVIVCLLSCDSSNKTNEEYEILSLVYKEFIENKEWGGEMPPPPQKYPKSWLNDSIPMTSQVVAELQNKQEIRNQEWLKKIKSRKRTVLVDVQYSGCYQNPNSKQINYDYLDLDKIKHTNKYKLKKYIEFQKIDTLNVLGISFSDIEFDETRDKASLELSITQGRNWGLGWLFF